MGAAKKKGQSKSDRVRAAMLRHPEKSPLEIAQMLGVTPTTVHGVRHRDKLTKLAGRSSKKKGKKKRGKGNGVAVVGSKLKAIEEAWNEIRAAHAILGQRLAEIEEMING